MPKASQAATAPSPKGQSASSGGESEATKSEDYSYIRADGRPAVIRLVSMADSAASIEYWVEGQRLSEWQLKHPVFRFCCGDITGDSIPEIAVGVVKATRYSPEERNRLFLFKLFDEELIRPLWLSSRLSHRLIDFTLEPEGTVATEEQQPDGTMTRVRYRIGGFGLKFVKYIND